MKSESDGEQTIPHRQGPKRSRRSRTSAPPLEGNVKPSAERRRAESKIQKLVTLLRGANGATLEEMMSTTGWQPHSVRGALSGTIKRKLGLTLVSEIREGVRVYRVVEAQP